jgi:hypothetical protein
MYLYKHPKGLNENRRLAGRIIQNWSRRIFHKSADPRDYNKEDREARDREMLARQKERKEEPEEPEEPDEGLR